MDPNEAEKQQLNHESVEQTHKALETENEPKDENQQPQKPEYESSSSSQQNESSRQQQLKEKPKASSPLKANQVEKTRYKYCCKVCKHTDRGKKACVCVVPLSQRRTILGQEGCQTCKCKGCSIEDFISRGQDPIYKIVKMNKDDIFDPRKMCCKKCMKAFYNNGKPCFCQLSFELRKGKLSSNGCSLCGCRGCNTDDYKGSSKNQKHRQRKKQSKSRSRERKRKHRSRSSSKSSSSPETINAKQMNFNNFDRSILGSMIINEYRVFPGLLGFGIPQRTSSYIMNKPS